MNVMISYERSDDPILTQLLSYTDGYKTSLFFCQQRKVPENEMESMALFHLISLNENRDNTISSLR